MTSKDTALYVHGSFSWGFTSNQKTDNDKNKDKKKGDSAPGSASKKEAQMAAEEMDKSADESKEKEDEKKKLSWLNIIIKKLSKFITPRIWFHPERH